MKFLQEIFCLCFLLLVPLVVESSSSLNDTSASNIARGSSLFSNNSATPYWLSSSGNFAFGFYQLRCRPSSSNCADRYVVGIWPVKSPQKTLVWSANRDDTPLHKPSSILFTDEGKLVLRILPENKDKPLIPDIQEPVSYAKMHDNGNFVLYGSDAQTVWESFDHPTDTILGGQKLKDGVELVSSVSMFNRGSGAYKLPIRQSDGGSVAIYERFTHRQAGAISNGFGDSVNSPVTLNLDTTGELYLVGSDDVVLRYLYRNKKKQLQESDEDDYIYRATLDSTGDFVLYEERIDGNVGGSNNSSSNVVLRRWSSAPKFLQSWIFDWFVIVVISIIVYIYIRYVCYIVLLQLLKSKQQQPAASGGLA